MTKTVTKTMAVPERVSFLEGQVTFLSSVFTSLKKVRTLSNAERKLNSMLPPAPFSSLPLFTLQ